VQAQLHLHTIAVAALEQPGCCNGLVALAIDQQQAAAARIIK